METQKSHPAGGGTDIAGQHCCRPLQARHVRDRHCKEKGFSKHQNTDSFGKPTWFLDVGQAEGGLDGGEGGEGRGEDQHNTGCPTHQDQDQDQVDRISRRISGLVILPISGAGAGQDQDQVDRISRRIGALVVLPISGSGAGAG